MPTARCLIKLFSQEEYSNEELELYAEENWTKENESYLLTRIQQLLTQIRPLAHTLRIDLQVQVYDTVATSFLLHKKLSPKNQYANTQKLTEREQQVMDLIVKGFTNKEIAQQLYISVETVRSHRKHIMLKTGSKNTALLVKYYDQQVFNGADAYP